MSERDADADAEVVDVVDRVDQQVAGVGGIAVVERHVEAHAVVRAREDADTHFGRHVETPRVGILLDDVVIGGHLGIAGSHTHAYIGLEDALLEPVVSSHDAERKLEQRVFLVGRHGSAVTQLERLARDVLEVGLVRDEGTDGQGRRHEVAALEVHAPPRSLVRELVAQGNPHLPVDVHVGVREELRLARQGSNEQRGTQDNGFQVSIRFHIRSYFRVQLFGQIGRLHEGLLHGVERALKVERRVAGQQPAGEAVPDDRQFLAALLVGLQVEHLGQQRAGRVAVVDAVGIVPAQPVTPVARGPVVGIVPPPVGVVVPHEVGHLLDIAHLDAHVGCRLVVGARVAGVVHCRGYRRDDLLSALVLPVFGPVAAADQQDAVREKVGVDGGEVGAGVVSRVDQVIPVQVRCRRLLLARAERNCCECERCVTQIFDNHGC
uniref:Uncharacterized protein n=1 Tax=Siphoviridae sp. ctBLh2 TaxID=2827803 RepID=A0A8S5S397_9CAUD|nr:MAG TPA: hypothetical protein [Siphoviridae sp. ctBLh2]